MNKLKKLLPLLAIIAMFLSTNLSADIPHFIDFGKVLNESKAGAEAQKKLKSRMESEGKKFKNLEEQLRKQETEIISQKKIITKDEYQKKVESLRKKVAELQKDKRESFSNVAKSRNKAKSELLKALNPIMKKYMEDKKIRVVLDKKTVLLADSNLDITKNIIELLNKNLKSLNF